METAPPKEPSFVERFASSLDEGRLWLSRLWRIGKLMAQGAYLVSERKRMFGKLGEAVYDKVVKGEIQNKELEPLVHQLDRLTKKIEIEEMLIRGLRFGGRANRASRHAPETTGNPTQGV